MGNMQKCLLKKKNSLYKFTGKKKQNASESKNMFQENMNKNDLE